MLYTSAASPVPPKREIWVIFDVYFPSPFISVPFWSLQISLSLSFFVKKKKILTSFQPPLPMTVFWDILGSDLSHCSVLPVGFLEFGFHLFQNNKHFCSPHICSLSQDNLMTLDCLVNKAHSSHIFKKGFLKFSLPSINYDADSSPLGIPFSWLKNEGGETASLLVYCP